MGVVGGAELLASTYEQQGELTEVLSSINDAIEANTHIHTSCTLFPTVSRSRLT